MEYSCVPIAVSDKQVLLSFIKKIWFRPAKKAGSLNKASCQLQHTLKNNTTENSWDKWYLLNSPLGHSGLLYSFYTYACSQFWEECSMSLFPAHRSGCWPHARVPLSLLLPPLCHGWGCLSFPELSWHTVLQYNASKEDNCFLWLIALFCLISHNNADSGGSTACIHPSSHS